MQACFMGRLDADGRVIYRLVQNLYATINRHRSQGMKILEWYISFIPTRCVSTQQDGCATATMVRHCEWGLKSTVTRILLSPT